jgi:hypothetical protein
LGGQSVVFPLLFILILSGNDAHKLIGNATPNESRYDWNLPSGVLPLLIERVILVRQQYEMRTEKEKESKKEENFKSSNNIENKEHKSSDCSSCESDAEEANFVRKLKKGSRKYKGKLPYKCFNCGKVGHFVTKCPYAKK